MKNQQRLWYELNADGPDAIEEQMIYRDFLHRKCSGESKLVLVVLYEAGHYVLLALEFRDGELIKVRYVDTLTTESAPCRNRAAWVLSLFGQHELPARYNHNFQPKGSMRCGVYALVYCEIFGNEFLGSGPSSCGHPELVR